MRALGYFGGRDDSTTLDSFQSWFDEYCYLNLHQPIETFVEISGANGGRPQLQRLLGYIEESGSSFLVVVPDATHLGGDIETVARSVVKLETAGAKVVCGDEELPDPLQGALQLLGPEGVSQSLSTKIRESMRQRALEGRSLGRPPYGYRSDREGALEVVPEEAEVVKLVFRLYAEDGLGLRRIAQRLNADGIPTRRGGVWSLVAIRDILKNPAYTGAYSRFGLRLPRNHEPIVPHELFRKARDTTWDRRPRGRVSRSEPFLLAGLAYCSYCGNRMIGATRRRTWRRQDGRRATGVYRYYQCQSRQNQGRCGYHTWRSAELEGRVGEALARKLLSASGRAGAGSDRDGDERLRCRMELRLANAEKNFVRVMRRTAAGEIGTDRLAASLEELDRLRQEVSGEVEPFDDEAAAAAWGSLTYERARRLVERRVERIVVSDDRVEVVV